MNGLTGDAKKVLHRWSQADFYVYIRILSSTYFNPADTNKDYWVVSVECRTVPPVQIRGEGYDLSSVIMELAPRVPLRSRGYKVEKPGWSGWLVPEQEERKAARRASENRKSSSDTRASSERPQRRRRRSSRA